MPLLRETQLVYVKPFRITEDVTPWIERRGKRKARSPSRARSAIRPATPPPAICPRSRAAERKTIAPRRSRELSRFPLPASCSPDPPIPDPTDIISACSCWRPRCSWASCTVSGADHLMAIAALSMDERPWRSTPRPGLVRVDARHGAHGHWRSRVRFAARSRAAAFFQRRRITHRPPRLVNPAARRARRRNARRRPAHRHGAGHAAEFVFSRSGERSEH